MMNRVVVETCNKIAYPEKTADFRPSRRYPEYDPAWPIDEHGDNQVYDCVRNAFIRMGYDKEHQGTPQWNPLSDMIAPGNTVLIKPNLVHDYNKSHDTVECLYTQPGVIAAVLDYVFLALGNTGCVIVGDAPMQECNFEKLVAQSGLDRMIAFYKERGLNLRLADFRSVVTVQENNVHHYLYRDQKGTVIDLGEKSEFSVLSAEENLRLRKGANDPADLHEHHNETKHEYEVCNELLQADVVIDMPKPKCHMKAGVTIALKNMVGINVRKEYLPHHTEGDKQSGCGDAYEKKSCIKRLRAKARDEAYIQAIKKRYGLSYLLVQTRRVCALFVHWFAKDKLTEGTWYGNETIAKTIIDLNKIVKYADKNGVLTNEPQRKRLIVADLIISGELKGPLAPTSKPVGAIAVGQCPVCFDETIATLMGADVSWIPTLRNARNVQAEMSLAECDCATILSNNDQWNEKTWRELTPDQTWKFRAIDTWSKAFFSGRNK